MEEKILVVEDDHPARRQLTRLLSRHGYDPKAVGSGREALLRSTRDEFDLIILDLNLGARDGWETLRRLRRETRTARVPVVVLTADQDTEELLRAYASGASYYMTKPCRSDELLRGLRLALHERSREPEADSSRW